jgi:hypothetical protein
MGKMERDGERWREMMVIGMEMRRNEESDDDRCIYTGKSMGCEMKREKRKETESEIEKAV